MLYPQNGDRTGTIDSVTSLHPHVYFISDLHMCSTHTHAQSVNSSLSGTTRVSRDQKKHSPTQTRRDHQTSFINFLRLLRSLVFPSFPQPLLVWNSLNQMCSNRNLIPNRNWNLHITDRKTNPSLIPFGMGYHVRLLGVTISSDLSLPYDLSAQQDYESFRQGLKTWLFSRY